MGKIKKYLQGFITKSRSMSVVPPLKQGVTNEELKAEGCCLHSAVGPSAAISFRGAPLFVKVCFKHSSVQRVPTVAPRKDGFTAGSAAACVASWFPRMGEQQ